MMTITAADAARRPEIVSACSFDVFDTFLVRACTTSDGVFERTYALSSISRTCPNVSESFVQHRIQAEARARRHAKTTCGSAEVHINDIYACFPFRLFGLDRGFLNNLVEDEFCAELDLCRTNPEMLRQYFEMKRAGHRVGFISDTYWSSERLGRLLLACCPRRTWDFLYPSCDNGSSKSEALFARYLSEQGIDAAASFHVGDNETADIKGARRHGIRPRYYPQASAELASKLQRETAIFELLCLGRPSRIDNGIRTLRRMAAAQDAARSAPFRLGLTVLGPSMTAFDAFIDARVAQIAGTAGRVAIGFLGRDGFLSHGLWRETHDHAAAYLEINRRVSLITSADTLAPLCDLLRKVIRIDAAAFADIVKVPPAKVAAFFATCRDGIAAGAELADALPGLMDAQEIAGLADGLRARLLAYLRHTILDFDTCTDLVLVDLGYAASVQKALRRIFDREGIAIRLHGAYLITLDDAFDDLAEGDTAEGLISDLVVTPHVKRMLIRNVALLEQLCCSTQGSVRDYEGSEALRELNPRPAEQMALVSEIQAGALAFAASARDFASSYALQPFAELDVAARWCAATLGRLLLLPDDDELALLGQFRHDVNLGSDALAPMLDASFVKNLEIARGLPAACTAPAPPMWLAGSFATLSPAHSYLYLLYGANRLPPNVFGETPCGTLKVGLFRTGGTASVETVTVFVTGLNDLRLRIPISRAMGVTMIALPLAGFAREGILHGVAVQTGATLGEAAESEGATAITAEKLVFAGLDRSGNHYHAQNADSCLLIPVDPIDDAIALYSVALTSLSHERILGTRHGEVEGAPWATLTWRGTGHSATADEA
jgi:FMN phosphatase YigB (HAD superfamily)